MIHFCLFVCIYVRAYESTCSHLYGCICVLTCTCACVYGGPALTLDLFLNLSPLYLLRQLAHCSRISSLPLQCQAYRWPPCLPCFNIRYKDLNSGSHTYISSKKPLNHHPRLVNLLYLEIKAILNVAEV